MYVRRPFHEMMDASKFFFTQEGNIPIGTIAYWIANPCNCI